MNRHMDLRFFCFVTRCRKVLLENLRTPLPSIFRLDCSLRPTEPVS